MIIKYFDHDNHNDLHYHYIIYDHSGETVDYFMKDLYVCERATGMKIVFILFYFRDALFY